MSLQILLIQEVHDCKCVVFIFIKKQKKIHSIESGYIMLPGRENRMETFHYLVAEQFLVIKDKFIHEDTVRAWRPCSKLAHYFSYDTLLTHWCEMLTFNYQVHFIVQGQNSLFTTKKTNFREEPTFCGISVA